MPRKDPYRRHVRRRVAPIIIALVIWLGTSPLTTPAQENDGAVPETSTLHLTLADAIRIALSDNRSLQESGYALERQAYTLEATLSDFDITYRPTSQVITTDGNDLVQGGLTVEKKFQTGITAAVTPGVSWSENTSTGEIAMSLSIPLLRGLGRDPTLDGVRSARFSLRSAERSAYTGKVTTVLSTVSALYDVLQQRELVSLSRFQIDQLAGHAAMARMKEKVGLASPIDVYRAEIRLKDAESALATAQKSLRNAEDNLKLLLALPIEKPVSVSAPLDVTPVHLDAKTAVKISLENRIELVQKEDELREAERRAEIARHNLLPRMDLVVDYRRYSLSDTFEEISDFGEERWGLSLTGTTDLARKKERFSYRQSLVNVESARLSYTVKKDEIITGVRRQLEALREALERVHIKQEQIRQAEGKLALSKIKFAYGMAGNFDVIEAETELQRGRVDLLSSKIDYIEGTYTLRAVLGTLVERPEG